jgi:hypothetical protein
LVQKDKVGGATHKDRQHKLGSTNYAEQSL